MAKNPIELAIEELTVRRAQIDEAIAGLVAILPTMYPADYAPAGIEEAGKINLEGGREISGTIRDDGDRKRANGTGGLSVNKKSGNYYGFFHGHSFALGTKDKAEAARRLDEKVAAIKGGGNRPPEEKVKAMERSLDAYKAKEAADTEIKISPGDGTNKDPPRASGLALANTEKKNLTPELNGAKESSARHTAPDNDPKCQRCPGSQATKHRLSQHTGPDGKCALCWCMGFVGMEQFGSRP